MTKYVHLDKLRPNNWYLNVKKLENIRQAWRDGKQNLLPAVLVTTIDDELSLLDGHCRAFAAWENGAQAIWSNVVSLEHISGIHDLYVIFHRQGPTLGVKKISDLGKRIYEMSETIDDDISVLIKGV